VYLGRWEGTTFYRAAACTDTAGVIVSLNEVAANPQQAAVAYARLTSTCCFCGTGLTDERSVRHGYGPICADRYNLPWDAPRTGSTVRGPRLAAPRTSAAASAMASMQASEEAAMMAEAAAIQAAERAEQQRADLHSIAQEGVVLDAEDRRFL
jgi:DNA-binding IclR family transcriptional regulator